ncbi:hypothetical protein LshimejAT787_0803080 [Lyophyllum shimeji]|uniref:Uncharacterized protein n=1 Tax=Lyophyllum shimeji TaxID=47721 RepID=A0A9P3UPM1_LYOSH|nr:hypothetical protein LshimejAT787_0803080 [Lyophyllum shimeji]
MKLWLSRAASLPLSITLSSCTITRRCRDVILPYLPRCRHLEISNVEAAVGIRIPAHYHFPDLETLHFRCTPIGSSVVDISVARESAPRLSEVLWEDGHRYIRSSYGAQRDLPSLPWAQLKRLTLGDGTAMRTSSASLLDCLAQCPMLEHADLNVVYQYTAPRVTVLLSSLLTLRLRAIPEDIGRNTILNYLNVPKLRELTLEGGQLNVPDLASFSQRSSFELETFQLRNVFIPLQSLIAALDLMSRSLKSLAIAHSKTFLTDSYVELLCRSLNRLYPRRLLKILREPLNTLLLRYSNFLVYLPDLIRIASPPWAPAWMVGWRLPLAVGPVQGDTAFKCPKVTHVEVDKNPWRIERGGLWLDLIVDMDIPASSGLEHDLEIIAGVYPLLYAWCRSFL